MKKKEYYTVKEVAEIVGQTRQNIYYHLNTKLKNYSKVLNGEKVISIKAFKEVYGIKFEPEDSNSVKNHSKDIQKDSKDIQIQNELILAYKERIEQLEQDKKQLQEDKRLLNENLHTVHELLSQEQKLHLATQTRLLALEHEMEEEVPAPTQKAMNQTTEVPSDSKKWWQFWK